MFVFHIKFMHFLKLSETVVVQGFFQNFIDFFLQVLSKNCTILPINLQHHFSTPWVFG